MTFQKLTLAGQQQILKDTYVDYLMITRKG